MYAMMAIFLASVTNNHQKKETKKNFDGSNAELLVISSVCTYLSVFITLHRKTIKDFNRLRKNDC